MAGGVHGKGACIAGGMHGKGHAWQGDVRGEGHAWWGVHGRGHAWWGHAWQGACIVMHGRGMHGICPPPPLVNRMTDRQV